MPHRASGSALCTQVGQEHFAPVFPLLTSHPAGTEAPSGGLQGTFEAWKRKTAPAKGSLDLLGCLGCLQGLCLPMGQPDLTVKGMVQQQGLPFGSWKPAPSGCGKSGPFVSDRQMIHILLCKGCSCKKLGNNFWINKFIGAIWFYMVKMACL